MKEKDCLISCNCLIAFHLNSAQFSLHGLYKYHKCTSVLFVYLGTRLRAKKQILLSGPAAVRDECV